MKERQLEAIIKSHHREAYFWAKPCCAFDDELAADVLQNVYLKILEGKAVFLEKSSPKTWLFSVIRLTALEVMRKEYKYEPFNESSFEIPQIEESETLESHEQLLYQLPKRQRDVLLLVFYHQMTIERSAEIMQVSLGTARTHYDRAKKSLKYLIENKQENQSKQIKNSHKVE
jgi:RNA polymerase sigma-70 factor (ECF subfamily)